MSKQMRHYRMPEPFSYYRWSIAIGFVAVVFAMASPGHEQARNAFAGIAVFLSLMAALTFVIDAADSYRRWKTAARALAEQDAPESEDRRQG